MCKKDVLDLWGGLDQNCGCHGNQKLPFTYNDIFSVNFDRFFAKLAGIQYRRKTSDEFKFQSDWMVHFSVTRILALKKFLINYVGKMIVSTLVCSLLIGSLSNLQATRTGIRSQTSSNSGLIRRVTLELFALDCSFIFYRIFLKLADNLSRHKISRVQNLARVDYLLWSYLP